MKKHRILVVEDDRSSRKLIARILESAGYEVLESSEGRDAIHIAELCPPAAMLIDVMLPDMQGTEIVEQLRKNRDCRFIKSVFLTGILSKKVDNLAYFFEIEGVKYPALPKPVRKDQLLASLGLAVSRSLEARRTADEQAAQPPLPVRPARRSKAERTEPKPEPKPELPQEVDCIEQIKSSPLW